MILRPIVQNIGAGVGLVLAYTGFISAADGITKLLAGGYAPPQLYALSGAIVVLLCLLSDRHPRLRSGLRSCCPWVTALRSAATVAAAACFFYAFRLLPFADVFLFIGLMPLLAGVMSGVLLREQIRPAAWLALLAGFLGVLCLFPEGRGALTAGHGFALGAAVAGTLSMVLARLAAQRGDTPLTQVFYPNLALCLGMAVLLPLVWVPMPVADLAWVCAYAVLLFAARWMLVAALRLMPAHVVTPLMNLQFVWMVAIGLLAFGELPQVGTWLGVAIVMASGIFLVWDSAVPPRAARKGPPPATTQPATGRITVARRG